MAVTFKPSPEAISSPAAFVLLEITPMIEKFSECFAKFSMLDPRPEISTTIFSFCPRIPAIYEARFNKAILKIRDWRLSEPRVLLRSMKTIKLLVLIAAVLSYLPKTSLADSYTEEAAPAVKEPLAPGVPVVEDPRLPPVIPGQEVSAGGGRRVRMISTTGPVVISSPTPAEVVDALQGASIVVDTRKDGID